MALGLHLSARAGAIHRQVDPWCHGRKREANLAVGVQMAKPTLAVFAAQVAAFRLFVKGL